MKGIEIKDRFYLNGEPFQLISGAVHYFRIVPQYWQDRLEKLKAMGCNTVETYIPWNIHEPRKGEFHFDGMCDIGHFLDLAEELLALELHARLVLRVEVARGVLRLRTRHHPL